MLQRLRQSRLLPSIVSAMLAATLAGGVAGAVSSAKADSETITMCVSALGTKIRFVHTAADCTSGEIVRTWNVEGQKGDRGQRGAVGPSGPSGPAGNAGTPAAAFSGGQSIDAAQSVAWYVVNTATPGTVTLATSTFTVPSQSRVYFVYWSATRSIPNATDGCADNATNVTPAVELVVNSTITAVTEATLTPVVMPAGTNSITLRVAQGRCTGALDPGATNNVTNTRLAVILG